MNEEYLKLPKYLLDASIKTGNEYGWRKNDVLVIIEAGRAAGLATIGGQVQYILPEGTCELYWLSYDSTDRKVNENWITYCNRSADECSKKFEKLLSIDIESDLINSFQLGNKYGGSGVCLDEYQLFIIYFQDKD